MEHLRLENERIRNEQNYQYQHRQAEFSHRENQARQDYSHRERMRRLENDARRRDNAHEIQLKHRNLQQKRSQFDNEFQLENLNVEREKIESEHGIEMARIENRRNQTKMVGEALSALLDKKLPATEFAYKAVMSSNVIRGEKVDTKALQRIAEHHMILENAKLAVTNGDNNASTSRRTPRQKALKDDK